MDPLSIIASSIAVAQAVTATADTLGKVIRASRELQDLIGEVDKLRIVLDEAQRVFTERKKHAALPQQSVDAGCRIVDLTLTQMKQVNDILSQCVRQPKDEKGKPRLAYVKWLRYRGHIKSLEQSLTSARLSLCSFWGVLEMSDNMEIQLSLKKMVCLNLTQLSQLQEHTQTLQVLAQHVCQGSLDENIERIDTTADPGQTSHDAPEDRVIKHAAERESTVSVRERYPKYRQANCERWCSCKCHLPGSVQTPHNLALVIGNLLISYWGFQAWQRKCSSPICRRQSIPTVNIRYQFPQWLLQRMLYLAFSISDMTGPELTLNMPRIISPDAAIFSYAQQGNMFKMQELFSHGLASPYDVASTTGRTALHYAVVFHHRELSQFLLDAGAKSSLQDKDNETPISQTWRRMLGHRSSDEEETGAWKSMFDAEDYLESRVFPPLHKVVLKISSNVSLRHILQLGVSNIDAQDAEGSTALTWAAARGDATAVSELLDFGANINVRNMQKQTPLHLAAQCRHSGAIAVMQLLVKAGAELDAPDAWGRTPLLYAAAEYKLDDPRYLTPLLEHEVGRASVNVPDCRSRTPLGYAAQRGRLKTIQRLLEEGADSTMPDNWGYTPVIESFVAGHHECLETLLEFHSRSGIPAQVRDGKPIPIIGSRTVLHLLAQYGKETTILLIERHVTDFCPRALDPAALSGEGMTADQIFRTRVDVDDGTKRAWIHLMETLDRRSLPKRIALGQAVLNESDSEQEVFEDAKESFSETSENE